MIKSFVAGFLCCLATMAQTADRYSPSPKGFIRDWLVGGPYPSYSGRFGDRGYATDFLAEIGGEAKAEPSPGLAAEVEFKADKAKLIAGIGSTNEWGFKETKTISAKWQKLHSAKEEGIISLDGRFAPFEDHLVAYAFCYIETAEQKEIKINVGSDDDHKIWLNGKLLGGVNKSQSVTTKTFTYPARLDPGLNRLLLKVVDRTHAHGFRVALTDALGKPLTDLRIRLVDPNPKTTTKKTADKTQDPAAAAKENLALEAELEQTTAALKASQSKGRTLARSVEKLQKKRRKLYARIERAYAGKRRDLRSTPPATDEPVRPATVLRRHICLNGDQWLGASAGKPKPGQPVIPPSAGNTWRAVTLPLTMFNKYFRDWHYPVRNVVPKNRYGKVESLPAWSDFEFNPLICGDRTWFRTRLNLSATEAENACTFVCENVGGKLQVFLNGISCGDYFGNVGIVSIPLTGMRAGENILDLLVEAPRASGIPQGKFTTHWGLRGDLFLNITTPTSVDGVDISTSWRQASIGVATTVENRHSTPADIRIEQYCVLGDRIKYRFPSRQLQLPGRKTTCVRNEGIWKEAKPWGIGGDYGDPVLYDLVTDLYVDGQLADRHVEPFGFREFWIAGTDFYLNGKRIILQGDVGLGGLTRKRLEVVLPLLRADGINTIRIHDSDYWSAEFLRVCDRLGMLAYTQMYPILHDKKPRKNQETGKRDFIPHDDWLKHPLHSYNLRNYERWVQMLRNHPSVVIASTDNEIFTQAWDRPESEAFNIRNDRLGAYYGRYVKSLKPSLVITRDGDEGTWGHKGKWHEEPPCDTANYHYPDFAINEFVLNWQSVYDFRPAVFGETLYCSYGAWNKWIGAIPSQVQKKAETVRRVASLYRQLEIPAQIYMGLSSDGFIQIDDTGKHNPWGITAQIHQEHKEKGQSPKRPRYPWAPIPWPSTSGPGMKMPAANINIGSYGHKTINWFDPNLPSHARNAVNNAYRDSLLPMPPLVPATDAECLIALGKSGGGKRLTARGKGIYAAAGIGIVADANGTAWFKLPAPGAYTFECEGQSMQIDVPSRASYAAKPGFVEIARFNWNPDK